MSQNNIALLVIDVQQGLFKKSTPIYKAEELLENINMLVDRAHRAGVPVFYIQHSDARSLVKGSPDWQLHSQLLPLNIDYIIHKQIDNAFEGTSLDKDLKAKNISSIGDHWSGYAWLCQSHLSWCTKVGVCSDLSQRWS